MKGAIARAEELAAQVPNAWIPQQFDNPANADIHASTTAQEVLADFPDGLDALITGVGTGGHLTGVARVLKAKFPQLKVFAVEPKESAVISGGAQAPMPFKVWARALSPRTWTPACWTAPSKWRPKPPANTPAAPPRKRGCWSESPGVPRWPPLPKNCRSCPPAAGCWALPTTRASATCPYQAFCLPNKPPRRNGASIAHRLPPPPWAVFFIEAGTPGPLKTRAVPATAPTPAAAKAWQTNSLGLPHSHPSAATANGPGSPPLRPRPATPCSGPRR